MPQRLGVPVAPQQRRLVDALFDRRALNHEAGGWQRAMALYEKSRVARTARVVPSAREIGRIYHAKGVERRVRNEMWKGCSRERFYDALEWLYGWIAGHCWVLDDPAVSR